MTLTVGKLKELIKDQADDTPVILVHNNEEDVGDMWVAAERVAIGWADAVSLGISFDISFSTKRFYTATPAVAIIAADDEIDSDATIIYNGVAPEKIS